MNYPNMMPPPYYNYHNMFMPHLDPFMYLPQPPIFNMTAPVVVKQEVKE